MNAWETYYDYARVGAVGGDYCDLVAAEGSLFFFFGDAVGKGIAGSMIASQLHSLFRALLPLELPLNQLPERINRVFCQSAASDYSATLVCGRASSDGALELLATYLLSYCAPVKRFLSLQQGFRSAFSIQAAMT